MKEFVTGIGGQLGHDVMNELFHRGHDGTGAYIAEYCSGVQDGAAITPALYLQLNITDEKSVRAIIDHIHLDAIIHCAAWTVVDTAEDQENREKVHAINALETQDFAIAAKIIDAKMLYLSTDYVFDGQGAESWESDCKDYKPLDVYGQSKLEGELAVSGTIQKFLLYVLYASSGYSG